MDNKINKLLFDIKTSIETIDGFLDENKNFVEYTQAIKC